MSNKDRAGKTIAFYTDRQTVEELYEMARNEHRSLSNYLTVLINREWDRQFPPAYRMFDRTIPAEK